MRGAEREERKIFLDQNKCMQRVNDWANIYAVKQTGNILIYKARLCVCLCVRPPPISNELFSLNFAHYFMLSQ